MPRKPGPATPPAICVRGTRAWMTWLHDYARGRYHVRAPEVIDLALARLAEVDGYPPPPPRLIDVKVKGA